MAWRGLFGGDEGNRTQNLSAQVEEMSLYLAAWLRQREEELRDRDGVEADPGPSDLHFDDEDIFGDMA